MRYPSSANAKSVWVLLPTKIAEFSESNQLTAAVSFIYEGNEGNNFPLLSYQVLAKDPNAIKLAFRLFTLADGAFAEDLDITLGRLIRVDPQLFLQQLQYAPKPINTTCPADLVSNFGQLFVDNFRAQRLEAALRIKALQTVQVPRLAALKNECIKTLSAQIG